MPHVVRTGSAGQLRVSSGSGRPFIVPDKFLALFSAVEQGTTLSKLVDQIKPSETARRFQLIKAFVLFLNEHDLLADREFQRLADSLSADYRWSASILTTDLADIPLCRQRPVSLPSLGVELGFLITTFLVLSSVYFTFHMGPRLESDSARSLAWPLFFFFLTFSLARSFQAFWTWLMSGAGGPRPFLDLVIEPISIRLRQEQRGKGLDHRLQILNVMCWFTIFVVSVSISRLAQSVLEFEIIRLAGVFAFLTETSPYSRSSVTDLLRSRYAEFELRGITARGPEDAIRRTHTFACFSWILLLGMTLVLIAGPVAAQVWQLAVTEKGAARISALIWLAVVLLFGLNWLAEIAGTFSYEEASGGDVRRRWRRKKESVLESIRGQSPSAQDLEKLPFLRQIPDNIRDSLLKKAHVRSFYEGQAICRQGETNRDLFVVLEGRLAVARSSGSSGAQSRRKVVAWLDPGAVFGENAFFFGQARSADIVGMEAGRVLVLPHTSEMLIVESNRSSELRVRIWFLQALMQSELFKELPSDSLDSVLHSGVEQTFASGTKIIQEGATADACYFVVQGRATVIQNTKVIGHVGAGEAFGEISILFPGLLRTATITAETDLMTIRIDREIFSNLLQAHLPLALEIERLGWQRLKNDKIRSDKA